MCNNYCEIRTKYMESLPFCQLKTKINLVMRISSILRKPRVLRIYL